MASDKVDFIYRLTIERDETRSWYQPGVHIKVCTRRQALATVGAWKDDVRVQITKVERAPVGAWLELADTDQV